MTKNAIDFIWKNSSAANGFRAGVTLHGHTMYSQECMSFFPRYVGYIPGSAPILRRYQEVDFSRAYWTPPLSPASALRLEREQIASLGLQPLVSLTDHDDIEAPMSLQVTERRSETPVSVEWTVPYNSAILHFGIHNLPPDSERGWLKLMTEYTAAPDETRLPGLLASLREIQEVLIVLNHPFWCEEGVEPHQQDSALNRLFRECLDCVHAFELNGARSWKENAATVALARAYGRPLISGGDRHACEPSACINLTNASSFSEFAAEIREGQSAILFMQHYRDPMPLRILDAAWDILRPYPEYPSRELWTDRIFYRGEDDQPRPLSAIWNRRTPWMLGGAACLVQLLASRGMREAMRLVLMEQGEASL